MEEVKQVSAAESEKLQGIISQLSIGDVKCDKCGNTIRHMERYCCNTRECYKHLVIFNNIVELNSHFIEEHATEQPRGTRYCIECSFKAGYLKKVRNKKTGEEFPAMLVLRDEELIENEKKSEKK